MELLKKVLAKAGGALSLAEILFFGFSLFCLIPSKTPQKEDPILWVYASISFLISRVLARRRSIESWGAIFFQSTIFAFFAYIILNNYVQG